MIHLTVISQWFQEWEGRKLTAYIPCYVREEARQRVGKATRNYTGDNGSPEDYRVMGASGVTIGTGCDLGQQTAQGLLAMDVPQGLVARFTPYLGLSGDRAIHALHAAPFSLSEMECDQLDLAVIGTYVRRAARLYDGDSGVPFAAIPPEAQAVAAHLFYHLGGSHKYPRTWAFLTRQDWQAAADELCNGDLWSGPYDQGRASEGRLLARIPGVR